MDPRVLVIPFVLAINLLSSADAASIGRTNSTQPCTSFYCCLVAYNDECYLLKTIQLAGIFNDSKTFVDLTQRHDPNVTQANFDNLMQMTNNNPSRTQLTEYVTENFVTGNELQNWTLPDWKENPPILRRIQDPNYKKWAKNLNSIWKTLARKVSDEVAAHPDRHTLIYLKNGFIIAGGRFREIYYWDSYWVIEGLLLSGMTRTARGMIDNFLSLVERYGFVPNGGRVYYLMRSQPPLLISMVQKYLEFTGDHQYLARNIATLEKEFAFWQQNRTVTVKKNGKAYTMARYVVINYGPRPESFKEDYRAAQILPESKRPSFYNDVKAGAESGWDFSSRWFRSNNRNTIGNITDITTSNIIPVDLNAMLQRNARLLRRFHLILENVAKAQYYDKVARSYQEAIDNVLWNEEEGTWLDFDMENNLPRKAYYPSNLTPLYTNSYNRAKTREYALKAVDYLVKNNISAYFGTPTSFKDTGEQWDFPNAWPPLQSFIVVGLYQTGVKEAMDLSKLLANRWLESNYIGYEEYGKMFEKYDALIPGSGGGGGEYTVQDGFGFTNGVALEFLQYFPTARPDESLVDKIVNNAVRG